MILNLNPSDDGHDAVADYNFEDDGFTNVWWNVSFVYGKQSNPALQRDTRLILQLDRYLGGQFALHVFWGKSLDIFSSLIQPA